MTTALIKALEYLGTVFLVGAGVYRTFVALGPINRFHRPGVGLGAALLVTASLADVVWRLWQVIGRFDLDLTLTYLTQTAGGHLMVLRVGLVVLALLTLHLPWRAPFLFVSLGVLYSFSASCLAAVMDVRGALVADLGHFVAACLWGGAIVYSALNWSALGTARLGTLERVSRIGLGSVVLLALTGVYATTIHLNAPGQLVSTPYGLALSLKLTLVALILGIAALNRWRFLPRLRADPESHHAFGRILVVEACLLLTVFAASGLLTTSPLPHD